jgi:hypothetical protein
MKCDPEMAQKIMEREAQLKIDNKYELKSHIDKMTSLIRREKIKK